MSDHFFVGFRLFSDSNIPVPYAEKPRSVVFTYNRQVDLAVVNFAWNLFIASTFPGDRYDCFVAHLTAILKVSKRVVIVKQRKIDCPWINTSVLAAIEERELAWARCRRFLKNNHLRAQFKTPRNKANAVLRSEKRNFFHNTFSDCKKIQPKLVQPLIDYVVNQ